MNELEVKNLEMIYPEYRLSCDDFKVKGGSYLTIVAASGFGKTTLLRGIMGFAKLSQGQIILNDEPLEAKPPEKRNFGVVFQDHLLFPHLTAIENALFGLKLRNQINPENLARANAGFDQLGLSSRKNTLISVLSGGERQRVALLRATLFSPSLLILDEPVKGLDLTSSEAVMNYLRQFLLSHPVPVIWVSHQGEHSPSGDRIIGIESPGRRHFKLHRSGSEAN